MSVARGLREHLHDAAVEARADPRASDPSPCRRRRGHRGRCLRARSARAPGNRRGEGASDRARRRCGRRSSIAAIAFCPVACARAPSSRARRGGRRPSPASKRRPRRPARRHSAPMPTRLNTERNSSGATGFVSQPTIPRSHARGESSSMLVTMTGVVESSGSRAELLEHGPPVHVRHHHVEQDGGRPTRLAFARPSSPDSADSTRKPTLDQLGAEDLDRLALIVDDEQERSFAGRLRADSRSCAAVVHVRRHDERRRKRQREGRALADLAHHTHLAAQQLDEPPHEVESEADAALRARRAAVDLVKRVEDDPETCCSGMPSP